MVFKKPYAFFIKYFKVINIILTALFSLILYKMYNLNGILNEIYDATVTNFSSLQATYLGFSMYLLMFLELVLLIFVIILLRKKDKPYRDYLLGILYLIILFVFFLTISDLFLKLENTIIEPASLKIYADLSFLIMIPCLYFIFRYIMIAIGFDIKKFNFTKDIIDLKSDEEDSAEVELIFTKNSYKYKRGVRRYFREMKYYFLENKIFMYIILIIFCVISFSTILGIKIFDSSRVKVNEYFVAGNLSYNVLDVKESKFDLHGKIIKEGYKFVIVNINVRNNSNINAPIDFNRIRLFYGDEYVYANNYYNDYFKDLGKPYDNSSLVSGELKNYIFIFKVPVNYKSKKYTIKFYNRNIFDEEINADYKVLKINAKNIDNKVESENYKLNEKLILDNKKYGDSNIIIKNYEISSSYKYKENNIIKFFTPKNSNSLLFILEYDFNFDKSVDIFNNLKNDLEFFKVFTKITYQSNGKIKTINTNNILKVGIDSKIFINVPYNFENAKDIKFIIKFRDIEYIYNIR